MKNFYSFTFTFLFSIVCFGQVTFTNASTSLTNSTLKSGVAIGVCDMNGDQLDDIIRLSNASDLQIEYQQASGMFSNYTFGNTGSGTEWGFAMADVDDNGYNDIIVGGSYNNLKLLTANSTGSAYTSSNLSTPSIFLQNINFVDIDNNGSIDIFACHDDGVSAAYTNDGSGTMTHDTGLINATSTVTSDNSGNYGSIWTDYDNDGDQDLYISKCRLGVTNAMDGRRLNLLFQNDGSGNYTDVASASGLRPLGQSWAASFEDFDNDGDMDCFIINHDIRDNLYRNNGDGTFTDITAASGIITELDSYGFGIQIIAEDFDNDTFVDILLTTRTASGSHYLFKNNGNLTFTAMASPFPTAGLNIQSAATGDLNNDGFMDIVAGFADGFNSPSTDADILFTNNGNSNHWSKIALNGVTSNKNGIGARIELHGAWGTQIREVRSGESYGIMNSLTTHFGLGSNTAITKVVVKWPSGTIDEILNPSADQLLTIMEGSAPLSNEDFKEETIVMFPNPTSDQVVIQLPNNTDDISIKISSITGKEVNSFSTDFTSSTSLNLNLEALSNGIYFVNISTNKGSYIKKLIKE